MRKQYHVVIVGGGFSGAALATHLLRCGNDRLEVTLVEAGERLARGVAYGTSDEAHLLNTRADSVSALPDEPQDFRAWLARNGYDEGQDGFVPRRLYGDYVEATLRASAADAARGGPAFVARTGARAVGVSRGDFDGFRIELADGAVLHADAVVLAIGHPRPADPLGRWIGSRCRRYVRDPWRRGALDSVEPQDRVLIVGTGLTAVDALVTLASTGHCRTIHAISRHGLLPRPHAVSARPLPDDLKSELLPRGKARGLRQIVRSVRACIAAANERGIGWQTVFDVLRAEVPELWASLDEAERRRFVEKIRPFWDVHRHRLAPGPAAMIEALTARGLLTVRTGRIVDAVDEGSVVRVDQHLRGESHPRSESYAWVINCAGATFRPGRRSLLEQRMLREGLLRADSLGLGYLSAPTGAALGVRGLVPGLYLLGPMCRPRALEHTAIAELAEQAEALAVTLTGAAARAAHVPQRRSA